MSEYKGLLWLPCFSTSLMEKCIEVIKIYNLTENKMVLGYPNHYQKVQDFWESRGFTKRITTGFYLVSVAMSSCREVHLYGFWPFSQEVDMHTMKSIPYHYFENMEVGKSKNFHDMHSEFSVLLQLHLLGILKIHVGICEY
ncbi:Alpha-N-acetylneuraminide alpha-2,8-sialyltransferase [Holothuria leucospilota]|uniref:Alpha-N-acetylneuraminide alpha-2,8-sialyltransferase n=1 Tax=Holothuria leucospilota TaxID=206669 RepID=A0A9Q1C6R4_HOLLE|nr:Alpha-N-acetylneuraminide alpha-2,8-sialyltransferase [Holothuria leucospilota]